ncbi:glycosyltransferase, partial [Nocardioides sp.]|uniref:glycosyltransferase n=1 Tax=Nocardioides sp. TaxID=35761 RepID=UPI00356925E8
TADLVVAVSDDVADRLRAGGLPEARLQVIENAVTVSALPGRSEARAALGLAADADVVLCLARLIPPKRQDLLIEAWSLMEGRPQLLLAGDGPARADLEEQTRAAGLESRVRFLGDRRDVARLLAASDVLVLPSDREGLPMTVLEAMSAGVPVVASAVGGLATLDPDAVELVAPHSAQALASGVSRLLADETRRTTMTEAAATLIRSRFSAPVMRERYQLAYSRLGATPRQ